MNQIIVEGNIAAGKSTFLKKLSQLDALKNGMKIEIIKGSKKILKIINKNIPHF